MEIYYISLLLDPIESKIKGLETKRTFERCHYLHITEAKSAYEAKKEALAYLYDKFPEFCVIDIIVGCKGEEIPI